MASEVPSLECHPAAHFAGREEALWLEGWGETLDNDFSETVIAANTIS